MQNENIDCSSVFNNHEDGEENEGDYCYSIDSFEECYQIGCEWDEEGGCFDPDGSEEENWEGDECRYFESEDECLTAGCEWGDDGCFSSSDDDNEDYCEGLN